MKINQKKSALSSLAKIDLWGYRILFLGVISASVFLLPFWSLPNSLSKEFLLTTTIALGLIFWLIGQLQSDKIILPQSFILVAGAILGGVSILAGLFSGSIFKAFFGGGSSVTNLLLLIILMFLTTSFFTNRDRILTFIGSLFYLAGIVGFYLIAVFVLAGLFGFEFFSYWPINFLGQWSEIGVFFGLMATLAVVALEFPFKRDLKKIKFVVLGLSIPLLGLIGFFWAWLFLGLSALIIFLIKLSNTKSRSLLIKPAFLVLIISLFFLLSGQFTAWPDDLLAKLNLQFIDQRPSFSETLTVTKGALGQELLLGVGPNQFEQAWLKYSPIEVNDTSYWNFDFPAGFSFLLTSFISLGLLGLLAWVYFFKTQVALIYLGLKSRVKLSADYNLSLFLIFGLTYLWAMAGVYTLSLVWLALAFFFTGLLLAWLNQLRIVKDWEFNLAGSARSLLIYQLILIFLLLITLVFSYLNWQTFSAEVNFYRGLSALSSSADLDGSERLLEKAIDLNSNQTLYLRELAELKLFRFNQFLNQANLSDSLLQSQFQIDFIGGLDLAQRAVEIEPADYRNQMTLGLFYRSLLTFDLETEKAYELAKLAYGQAHKLNPRQPEILIHLAQVDSLKGDLGGARFYLEKSLELKPDFVPGLLFLAQVDREQGETEAALTKTAQAVELAPFDGGVRFQLGWYQYLENDYQAAVESLDRALELDSVGEEANILYFLGLSYAGVGEVDRAVEIFEVLAEANPEQLEIIQIIENLKAHRPALTGVVENNLWLK